MKYKKTFFFLSVLGVSVVAFLLRMRGILHVTADIETCLIPWSAAMKPGSGFHILSTYDGDYNMPYVTVLWLLNYLPGETIVKVKLFSILFDYLAAVGAGFLVIFFSKSDKKEIWFLLTYSVMLFYPVSIMNSAYWGQCDYIYVTFILYMLLALFSGRYKTAMVLLGCAFSFKLQTILIVPFLLLFYWKEKKFSARLFLLVPVVMETLCIPAILGGCSVWIPFSVYLRQFGRYPYMYVFYPNFWALFPDAPYYIFGSATNLILLTGLGALAVVLIQRKETLTQKEWLKIAVWTVFFLLCFLPCMHERYGLLLEILLIIFGILEWKKTWLLLIICSGATIAYLQVTFAKNILSDKWIALAYLLSFGVYTLMLLREFGEEKENRKEEKIGCTLPEKKFIDFVSKNIAIPAFLIIIVLAVLIRKPMIGVMSADYLPNLIEVEGNAHTTFYMFLMHLLSRIESKPLLFLVKLLCMDGDLAVAAVLSFLIAGKRGMTAMIPWFALFMILPSTYLNSSLWGHLDSVSIALIGMGVLLYKLKKPYLAMVTLGTAVALLPYYLPFAVGVLAWKKEKRWYVTAVTMGLLSLTGLFCSYGFMECISKWNFFGGIGTWILYPLLMLLFCVGGCNRRFLLPAIIMEMTVILDWGEFLYEKPVLGSNIVWIGYIITVILLGMELNRWMVYRK